MTPPDARTAVLKCLYPKETSAGHRPCRGCIPCRINRQRAWVARMRLELQHHESAVFTTLTYDPDHVPLVYDPETGEHLQTLNKKDCQKWLKRLRKRLEPAGIAVRYFLTGEYGSRTQRPHYHAIIYGLSAFDGDLIQETWGLGYCDSKETNEKNIAYTAKYALKEFKKDDRRLRGRSPTFILTSRKPAIGVQSIPFIGRSLVTRKNGVTTCKASIDGSVRIGKSVYQLDRLMWTKLKSFMNLPPHIEAATLLRNSGLYDSNYGKAKAQKAERLAQKTSTGESF